MMMESSEDEYLDDYYEISDTDSQAIDAATLDQLDDHLSRPSPFQVITGESLLAAQREILQRVMELLMVQERQARTLLIHYRWDFDKLATNFIEKGQEHVCAQARVKLVERDHDFVHQSPNSIVFCQVCLENRRFRNSTRMDCQHLFCNKCWIEHFIVQISEGHSRRIRCMAHNCNTVCDESIVRKLVSKKNPDLAGKFDRSLLESYIEENNVPHCGNAIRVKSDELTEVGCSCGLQFCFSCSGEAHSPCSCLMWDLWSKKWKDESLTFDWIKVDTQKCPTCHKSVEKNGGCNIVRCRCGKPFCWICLKAESYNHNCGRYKEPGADFESAKVTLYRYMHYYDRFKAHRDSLKLEAKLHKTVTDTVSRLEEEIELRELNDFRWLENGLSLLFRSRKVLSYSYAFAYYMFGDELFNEELTKAEKEIKNLFEDQQQQFEANIERLSGLIEEINKCNSRDDVIALRSKVNPLSKVVHTLGRSMYDCIETDLVGSLDVHDHSIAAYRSEAIDLASEFQSIRYLDKVEYKPRSTVKRSRFGLLVE